MSYNSVVELIKAAAEKINTAGHFVHGRKVLASFDFNKPFPQIHLYPITYNIDPQNEDEKYPVFIGFFYEDKPDSNAEQQQAIIANADTLAKAFLTEIINNGAYIQTVTVEPNYQTLVACATGMLIRFTLTMKSEC